MDIHKLTIANPADDLLKRALAALNAQPRFKVPPLATDSYAIAAEIDDYFHKVALSMEEAAQ